MTLFWVLQNLRRPLVTESPGNVVGMYIRRAFVSGLGMNSLPSCCRAGQRLTTKATGSEKDRQGFGP